LSKKFLKYGCIALGLLVSLALVVLPGCGGTTGGTTPPYLHPGIFTEETIGPLDTLDPAYAYDTASGEQLTYIYETLLAYNKTSTSDFVPVLADSWSTSGTNITFHIRSGVRFSNGVDNVTAEDVEYSIERALVQDPYAGPIWMFYAPLLNMGGSRNSTGNITVTFSQIDNAVTRSGDNVTFHLCSVAWVPEFYQIMTGTWASILDKAWCVAHNDWDGTENGTNGGGHDWTYYNNPGKTDRYLYNHAMGTGPWVLPSSETGFGSSISLDANPYWWQGTPPFTNVVTKYISSWGTRQSDFVTGEADHVYVPRAYIHQLDSYNLTVYKDLKTLQCDAFYFNFNITTPSEYIFSGALDGNGIPANFFDDPNVRKGFAQAFDYATYIADALLGEGSRLGSPVVEGLPYYDNSTPLYNYNLAAANASLNAAFNGTLGSIGFKFTLAYNTGNLARQTACSLVANALASLNPKFKVLVQPLLWDTYVEGLKTGKFPMFCIGWLADYPDPDDFVVPFMASWGTFAIEQHYSNATIDALILAGENTTDPVVRQGIYTQLQYAYYNICPGIILDQPLARVYFTPYIHGFYYNPMIPGFGPLWDMTKSNP
jgi:peptide/nickel transport system substrate-binding protein